MLILRRGGSGECGLGGGRACVCLWWNGELSMSVECLYNFERMFRLSGF